MISIRDYETTSIAYENHLLDENHENSKLQKPNLKWFDKPFDRLTVLSKVEGLTTLSQVEGQIPMTQILNSKQLIHLQLCPTA
jgi:prophage tail gpP-like protein